jgi:alkylation response protein AidB-like acyl-CoA dehydrogenase
MDFELTSDQVTVRQTVRQFAEAEIKPHVLEWDEAQHFPGTLWPKLGALGLTGVIIPEQYGGSGMGYTDYVGIIEELARVDGAIALSVAAHNSLCANHIYQFGNDTQRHNWVLPLARGEKVGAWALTEAGSGSDAGAMRSVAVLENDHWTLNGTKNFITHGTVGDVHVVIAVTDRQRGSHGTSAFVLESGMLGFRASKKENKLGCRASDTSSLAFDDVNVPDGNRLGKVGDGFKQAMTILDGGRISIAALAVGIAQGAYESALQYAQSRQQFGKPISQFQAIQFKLCDMATQIEAARLMTYRAASLKDAGRRTTTESSMAKLYASEIAVKVAEEAVQIHGGYGYIKDYPAEKYWRDSKLCTIGEGTSEIQRLVIARQLLTQ